MTCQDVPPLLTLSGAVLEAQWDRVGHITLSDRCRRPVGREKKKKPPCLIRERRQVGRGYQKWVECGSPTHVGCTHILPTFSVGKWPNNGRHDLSSPHLPQPHSSDLCASNTFQLTSTPSTITPSRLGKRPGRPYDRAAVDGDGIQWA